MMGLSVAEALERSGWQRSVGGASPYLGLFARTGAVRDAVDASIANLEIHELSSARGCTYILPQVDFALGLTVGTGFNETASMNTARKYLGVTDAEIAALGEAILNALETRPLEPKGIKDAVGDKVRNLGEAGKKRGQGSTLSLSLGLLQTSGQIRRIPVDGRLDQQRYAYGLWTPSPLVGFELSREQAFTELGRKFFQWIGPATFANFVWFVGLSQKACRDALAPLGLVPVEAGSEFLILPEDFDAMHALQVPSDHQYTLVGSLDPMLHQRRDLSMHLNQEDLKRNMIGEKQLYELGSVMDLTNHPILDRGRLAGLWEYDQDAGEIVWMCFDGQSAELQTAIDRTQTMIRDHLGDARSFSLDSSKSRQPKIAALRAEMTR